MPDTRRHRGAHPDDVRLFRDVTVPTLREATRDFSWLLERGYASKSALALVGDRFQLAERQRMAVMRCSAPDSALKARASRQVSSDELRGQILLIDGYNALTTVEVALSDGLLFVGRDGCLRDIASRHGSFKRVEETAPSLALIGETLAQLEVLSATWFLDSPVSNSGRLRELMLQIATERGWNWRVELVFDPDRELKSATEIVATADSAILDASVRWFNLARRVVEARVPNAKTLDFASHQTE